MTRVEAQYALKKKPLVFGDVEQILAVKHLALLEELKEANEGECSTCGGSGFVECDCCGADKDCDDCDGFGVSVRPTVSDDRQLWLFPEWKPLPWPSWMRR